MESAEVEKEGLVEEVVIDGPETWRKEITRLQAESAHLDESIKVTVAQLRELREGLTAMDGDISSRVGKILETLPRSTPAGAVDELLKLTTPKRGQVLENISKLTIAQEQMRARKGALSREIVTLERKVTDHELNLRAKEWTEGLFAWSRAHQDAEAKFDRVKALAGQLHSLDPRWTLRLEQMKFPSVITGIAADLLRPGRSEKLSMGEFAETVGQWCSGGRFKGAELLFPDKAARHRDLGMDVVRETYMPGDSRFPSNINQGR